VQRIYLRLDGEGKAGVSDPKLTLGRMLNGACRLARAFETLGIAEGVETALSAMQLHGIPTWAACGSRMDAIAVPESVTRLVIFADNGAPGVRAAERAKAAHVHLRGVEIVHPPGTFKDFNDELRARAAVRVA
jgi:hypothetical protein